MIEELHKIESPGIIALETTYEKYTLKNNEFVHKKKLFYILNSLMFTINI